MVRDKTTLRAPRRAAAPQGPARLRIVAGAHVGETFDLTDGECIIGKGTEAQIRLSDSGVSRRHAKVVRSSDGMIVLLDLGSTNGTFVNEARVEMAPLRPGVRIAFGPDAVAEFGYGDFASAAPEPTERAKPVKHPLTPRELDIARLVAEGLTNAKIAERLSIKPRTVSSHLDNIYARLRISSRAALTRWFIESGLSERSET